MNTACHISIFSVLLVLQNSLCLAIETCAVLQLEMPINATDNEKDLRERRFDYMHEQTNVTLIHMSTNCCIYRYAVINYVANNTGKLMENSNEDNCSQSDIGLCKTVQGLDDLESAIICCYHWDGYSIHRLLRGFLNKIKLTKEANQWAVRLVDTEEQNHKTTEEQKPKNLEKTDATENSSDVIAGIIVGCLLVAGVTLVLVAFFVLRKRARNKSNRSEPYGLESTAEANPNLGSFFQITSARETASDNNESHACPLDEVDASKYQTEGEASPKEAYDTGIITNQDNFPKHEIDEYKKEMEAEDKNKYSYVYATGSRKDTRVKTKPMMKNKTSKKKNPDTNHDTEPKHITSARPGMSSNDEVSCDLHSMSYNLTC